MVEEMRMRNGRLISTIELDSCSGESSRRRIRGSRAVGGMRRGKGGEKEQSSSKQTFVFRVFPLQNISFLILPLPLSLPSRPSPPTLSLPFSHAERRWMMSSNEKIEIATRREAMCRRRNSNEYE